MNSLVKDMKIIMCCTKALKIMCALKTAMTVGIIVFTVLEGIKYMFPDSKSKALK